MTEAELDGTVEVRVASVVDAALLTAEEASSVAELEAVVVGGPQYCEPTT